jgi:hypothetical protein
MVALSYTSFGRMIAIILIICATKIYPLLGAIICCLVIIYYDQERFKNLLNINDNVLFGMIFAEGFEIKHQPYDKGVYVNLHEHLLNQPVNNVETIHNEGFDVRNNKINIEDELIRPKNSNDIQ